MGVVGVWSQQCREAAGSGSLNDPESIGAALSVNALPSTASVPNRPTAKWSRPCASAFFVGERIEPTT